MPLLGNYSKYLKKNLERKLVGLKKETFDSGLVHQYFLGAKHDIYSPYKIKNLCNFYYLIFFKIFIAKILAIIFLTIKKIDINKIILNIIKSSSLMLFYLLELCVK